MSKVIVDLKELDNDIVQYQDAQKKRYNIKTSKSELAVKMMMIGRDKFKAYANVMEKEYKEYNS